MEIGACSHIGKIREINEDAFFIAKNHENLFIVADGMGGHNAGEVASNIAIDVISEYIQKNLNTQEDHEELLIFQEIRKAVMEANLKILERSKRDDHCQGMGTTLTLALILKKVYIGHIGDSRAYRINKQCMTQITEDHSLVAELVKNGSITEMEAKTHPQRNIITRALGTDEKIKIDVCSVPFDQDDIIILCTDGLTNLVEPSEIMEYMLYSESIQKGCEQLVALANERGGFDNITILAIKNN
ncbi:protein phosphatase [Geosporobacter subterraneus DSM 17957]|uniref:Protein phosphatase n=1 Tax=Geosporobacter subterraneus DSM 17957 TaxID=1121919 RepID=A0A1M6P2D8_9FIRM|nr:Stp1/IreP family PP2C-type Ser/Thr phosphatase [Geosporobacter subterraneus]SHK02129.1 protein phosphatase [Geosporobacter subterraneus DSM 17957]